MDTSWAEERSIPVPESGCWLWLGAEKGNGYGNARHRGANLPAHRLAFAKCVGPVPAGTDVCHRCDTPLCVNPYHLFIGTRKENMRDAMRKGRLSTGAKHSAFVSGERAGGRKLSAGQVAAIRSLRGRVPVKDIAAVAGVSQDNIRRIIRRDTWKELNKCAE